MRTVIALLALISFAASAADAAEALIKAEQAFSKRSVEVGFVAAMAEVLAEEAAVLDTGTQGLEPPAKP